MSNRRSEADLADVLKLLSTLVTSRLFILGRGSNLLVRDGGFRGLVLCLAHPSFSEVEADGQKLRCGAGARLRAVAAEARRHSLTGFEFLEGIPGTVGGALRMNAGAMGSAIFDVVQSVRCLNLAGEVQIIPASQMCAQYRGCEFLKSRIVLDTILAGRLGRCDEIVQKMTEFSQKRWKSQPASPSAGCMFKNPVAIPAGKLIDELGLKGTRIGGALVSAEHGNFLVNEGNATARDFLELMETIRRRAREARGIELEPEVEIIGDA